MLNTLRQSHLEYVAKVLGARSVISPEHQMAPTADLLVMAPRAEVGAHNDLFGKVLAAWDLAESQIRVVLLEEGAQLPDSGDSKFVLAFYPDLEGAPDHWIVAGSLSQLSSSQDAKRALWQKIKLAKSQLNGASR